MSGARATIPPPFSVVGWNTKQAKKILRIWSPRRSFCPGGGLFAIDSALFLLDGPKRAISIWSGPHQYTATICVRWRRSPPLPSISSLACTQAAANPASLRLIGLHTLSSISFSWWILLHSCKLIFCVWLSCLLRPLALLGLNYIWGWSFDHVSGLGFSACLIRSGPNLSRFGHAVVRMLCY